MNQLPAGVDSPLQSIGATRALFEETARKLVLATANIAPRFGAVVSGLQMADDGRSVTGALLVDDASCRDACRNVAVALCPSNAT